MIHAVEAQLRLHDRALAASSCGITIADCAQADMPLIYVNASFARITGYTQSETLGRNCRFLQREERDQPELTALRSSLRSGQNCTITIRNYRQDGSLFWNELFTSPITDEQGRVTHYIGIQTDVTARKLVEEALAHKQAALEQTLTALRETQTMLVHSEKMSALGQMVAGIAHEINNPVSFVNSNLHSLRGALGDLFTAFGALETLVQQDAAQLSDRAAAIRRDSDFDFLIGDTEALLTASMEGLGRVKRIVEALRTFSRLDEAELKVANIGDNLRSALVIARAVLRDTVAGQLDVEALPDIQCYPAELNQVFLNLIVNAAQAIEERGTLTIRGYEAGAHVILEFTDTGCGMTPEVQQQIFNPFFTTKPVGVGTGLGLAIAYKLITDRHHGIIKVASTPGVGSTFTLILPKEQPA